MTHDTPGQRLRAARRAAGLSAAELGERAALIAARDKPVSPSAVRNQENGTNGIPWTLVVAYAKVLGVSAQWLLFGRESSDAGEHEVPQADVPTAETESSGEESIDNLEIEVVGPISASWEEFMPLSQEEYSSPYGYYLYIDVAGFWGVKLEAYLVSDESLLPDYPRGTYLICAPVYHTGVRDRDHVILEVIDEGEPKRSIREARKGRVRGGSATLHPIGLSKLPPMDWFAPGISRRIYPWAVVVATYRPLRADERGRVIKLPDHLEDTLEGRQGADLAAAAEEVSDEVRERELLRWWRKDADD